MMYLSDGCFGKNSIHWKQKKIGQKDNYAFWNAAKKQNIDFICA